MKRYVGRFLGLGQKELVITCDKCHKSSGRLVSLISGDYCEDCVQEIDPDASHKWIPINYESRHFERIFNAEPDSHPPTHLDYCVRCGAYRALQKKGGAIVPVYYFIGSKNAHPLAIPCNKCRDISTVNKDTCVHSYVKVLSTEKNPSDEEIRSGKKTLAELKNSQVGRIFGYTDIDMANSTFGRAFYWCSSCGYSRGLNRINQILPSVGTDKNYPDTYST